MYIGTYLFSRLHGININALGLTDLTIYTALTVIPLIVIWMIWSSCYRFYHEKNLQKQFKTIETKLQQNQDFFEMAARLLYQAQKSRENHFILNQTELFIAELNGMIADILQRYKFITESEAVKLWVATEKGNKWCFAKALIDLQNSSSGFNGQLYRTAQREKLLRGNINEFCARYARLLEMLKAHDKERIFLDIVETGAMGKAFAILAPLSDKLQDTNSPVQEELFDFSESEKQKNELFADAEMKIAQIDEQSEYLEQTEDKEITDNVLDELDNISLPEFLSAEDEKENELTPQTIPSEFGTQTNEQDVISENEQTLEETVAVINALSEKEDNGATESSEIGNMDKKEMSLEEEIGRMFDGAGLREYENDEMNNDIKPSIFPKFSNLFKKKNIDNKNKVENDIVSQSGIDPLTLALERSFGKLADDNPNQNSRLHQMLNSDKKDENQTNTGEEKFSFSTTNETLMKLQQELAELSNSVGNSQTPENKGENADKKEI